MGKAAMPTAIFTPLVLHIFCGIVYTTLKIFNPRNRGRFSDGLFFIIQQIKEYHDTKSKEQGRRDFEWGINRRYIRQDIPGLHYNVDFSECVCRYPGNRRRHFLPLYDGIQGI